MIELAVYALRSLILILGIWFVSVIIGKKSLLQMTPFDIGILMIISNVVSQPLVNKDVFKTTFGIIVLRGPLRRLCAGNGAAACAVIALSGSLGTKQGGTANASFVLGSMGAFFLFA